MIKLRFGESAKKDLRDIRAYSKAQFGPDVAKSYLAGLTALFSLLRERPNVGASERDLGADVRGFAYRSHRVYYQHVGNSLTILRILHHSRDAQRHVGDRP